MLHVQIRNETNLLQQQLVSLEANVGENAHLERVLQAIACLDFVDQTETDAYMQEIQTGLQLLTQQLKQKNASSVLVINAVNDVNVSFRRLRSLYIQRRLQLFREKVTGAAPAGPNPGLRLEQNLQMSLRRLDGQTNAKLRQINGDIDGQLAQIHAQLLQANPQPIDLGLFTREAEQMLTQLGQTLDQLQKTLGRLRFPDNEVIAKKIHETNSDFTTSFRQSLEQGQKVSALVVQQPTEPVEQRADGCADDVQHCAQLCHLTSEQLEGAVERYRLPQLGMLICVRQPPAEQLQRLERLRARVGSDAETREAQCQRLEERLYDLQREYEANQVALERGRRRLRQ